MRLILQDPDEADCGFACLAMLADLAGIEEAKLYMDATKEGYVKYKHMKRALRTFGFTVSGLRGRNGRATCHHLREFQSNLLLKTTPDGNGYFHWMVWNGQESMVFDPLRGKRTCPQRQIAGYYRVSL